MLVLNKCYIKHMFVEKRLLQYPACIKILNIIRLIIHVVCVEQENKEREAVERRRKEQRGRETLSRVAKRRTIAACSSQSTEHEALESVLTSFLRTRPSRRRQPSSNRESPTEEMDKENLLAETSHVALDGTVNMDRKDASISLQDQDHSFQIILETSVIPEQYEISHNEEEDKSCLVAQDSPEKAEIVVSHTEKQEEKCLNMEKIFCGVTAQCTPVGPKRTPCIDDKATPKSTKTGRRRSILVYQNGGEKDEQEKNNKDQAKEDFQKTSNPAWLPLSEVSSPHHRGIQEGDLALQNGFGSPWTVLSPHVSPSCLRRRRHSFGSTNEECEDGVWALPDTPVKGPPIAPMCRSYEHRMSNSVIGLVGIRDSPLKVTSKQGNMLRSASVGENPESISSFRFSTFFPRCHGRETKRQELSSLKSFFQRFGEKRRPASVGDESKPDT